MQYSIEMGNEELKTSVAAFNHEPPFVGCARTLVSIWCPSEAKVGET